MTVLHWDKVRQASMRQASVRPASTETPARAKKATVRALKALRVLICIAAMLVVIVGVRVWAFVPGFH